MSAVDDYPVMVTWAGTATPMGVEATRALAEIDRLRAIEEAAVWLTTNDDAMDVISDPWTRGALTALRDALNGEP